MKKFMPVILAFVLALAMPALAFAEGGGGGNGGGGGGGTGSGGGAGGGASEPLVVVSTSIPGGAEVGAGDTITLVFSKNVCEASVRYEIEARGSQRRAGECGGSHRHPC